MNTSIVCCFGTLFTHNTYTTQHTAHAHPHPLPTHCSYNQDVEGVPLAYQNERILSQTATVHPYFPLIRLSVATQLLVFRPHPGSRLVGTVNKISDDFIGLVVMGFINTVVKESDIKNELQHVLKTIHSGGTSGSDGDKIRIGDSVVFRVTRVVPEGNFLTLEGAIKDKDTGHVNEVGWPVDGEEEEEEEDVQEKKGKKKRKGEEAKKKKEKESKKRKTRKENGDGSGGGGGSGEEKKKKRK